MQRCYGAASILPAPGPACSLLPGLPLRNYQCTLLLSNFISRVDVLCACWRSCCCPCYLSARRNAYNMVVNKHGERLYRGLVDTETAHLHKACRGTAAHQQRLLLL